MTLYLLAIFYYVYMYYICITRLSLYTTHVVFVPLVYIQLSLLCTCRFEGGLVEHSLRLSEGFAAVLELCDLMSTTREPWSGD